MLLLFLFSGYFAGRADRLFSSVEPQVIPNRIDLLYNRFGPEKVINRLIFCQKKDGNGRQGDRQAGVGDDEIQEAGRSEKSQVVVI